MSFLRCFPLLSGFSFYEFQINVSVPRIIGINDCLILIAFPFDLTLKFRNDRTVEHNVGIAHIIEDIIKRHSVGLDGSCDCRPDAVVSVSRLCRSRFTSAREAVSAKKSFRCILFTISMNTEYI